MASDEPVTHKKHHRSPTKESEEGSKRRKHHHHRHHGHRHRSKHDHEKRHQSSSVAATSSRLDDDKEEGEILEEEEECRNVELMWKTGSDAESGEIEPDVGSGLKDDGEVEQSIQGEGKNVLNKKIYENAKKADIKSSPFEIRGGETVGNVEILFSGHERSRCNGDSGNDPLGHSSDKRGGKDIRSKSPKTNVKMEGSRDSKRAARMRSRSRSKSKSPTNRPSSDSSKRRKRDKDGNSERYDRRRHLESNHKRSLSPLQIMEDKYGGKELSAYSNDHRHGEVSGRDSSKSHDNLLEKFIPYRGDRSTVYPHDSGADRSKSPEGRLKSRAASGHEPFEGYAKDDYYSRERARDGEMARGKHKERESSSSYSRHSGREDKHSGRDVESERDHDRDRDRLKELHKEREQSVSHGHHSMRERERGELRKEKEIEKERERDRYRERYRYRERNGERGRDRDRDRGRERNRDRDGDRVRGRERDGDKDRDKTGRHHRDDGPEGSHRNRDNRDRISSKELQKEPRNFEEDKDNSRYHEAFHSISVNWEKLFSYFPV